MSSVMTFVSLQLLLNLILDGTGLSKKYFTSSGAFVLILFSLIWLLLSLFISFDLFPVFFNSDFWAFIFWFPWLLTFFLGPVLLLIVQLFYSYLLKHIIFRKGI